MGLGDLFGGGSSSGSGSGGGFWSGVGSALVSSGLGAIGNVWSSREASKRDDQANAIKERELDILSERYQKDAAHQAMLAELERRAQIQAAYKTLIEAGLTGSSHEQSALNNLSQAGQAPLLRQRGI